ncbi:hypothetical protein X777_15928 [Ooceraea biroi]|uniref:Uncharacterized protein n=1 Tax=Ooceraea biroi TaxID=2015173 RepID=A0A026WT94_OOCBI|nr:hypothetical protein X777_15928 [Ooceraea biroi]
MRRKHSARGKLPFKSCEFARIKGMKMFIRQFSTRDGTRREGTGMQCLFAGSYERTR